jgi:hypothetical protein
MEMSGVSLRVWSPSNPIVNEPIVTEARAAFVLLTMRGTGDQFEGAASGNNTSKSLNKFPAGRDVGRRKLSEF